MTSDSGSITSPNWPSAYSRRTTCTWLVKLPRTERISYQVTQLVVVGSPATCSSYLELHDGPDETSPIIGKYCSQSVMANAVTTSNTLFVKFVTDGSGSLFRLGYTTRECGVFMIKPHLSYFFEVVCLYEEYPFESDALFIGIRKGLPHLKLICSQKRTAAVQLRRETFYL